MALAHNLGFPRIGRDRELKKVLESYWKGEIDQTTLHNVGKRLREEHWHIQHEAGIELLPVGDFAWYDHVLTHSLMFGVIPARHQQGKEEISLDTLFAMARGVANESCSCGKQAQEMTKWFDTNYHYLVPEFSKNQTFKLSWTALFDEITEAKTLGYQVKPVILGPLTYLWLGKEKEEGFNKVSLLESLLPVYGEVLQKIADLGVDWVQIDEPILGLDLPHEWKAAFEGAYNLLQREPTKKLVATYFSGLGDNLGLAANLPVDGLHIDLVRAPEQFPSILDRVPSYKILSLGVVNGRNVWRADLEKKLAILKLAAQRLGERLWIAPSCSLLHSPVDLEREDQLDTELKSWLAFAVQKCQEVAILTSAINDPDNQKIKDEIAYSQKVQQNKVVSTRINKKQVQERIAQITEKDSRRHGCFSDRIKLQHERLDLPLFPTTTIGSFPQTKEIRLARSDFKQKKINEKIYIQAMQQEIDRAIAFQEKIGLDVLVHGEPERNDMVEYFAEQLEGYLFTRFGWVQSYGSRCVKPAIIYGDLFRSKPMTVEWISYAQSKTNKIMKGMLTGPVTMLMWSFPREDIMREQQAKQLALAIRDEVVDLESVGIKIIQIDEAAFREGLPLRKSNWQHYLDWAVEAFRLCSSGVRDETQIHTHMCYSEFNEVITSIADMDADVITIETSRSQMELLDAFKSFNYPNGIGPGVYDIHSPRIPSTQEMVNLLTKAVALIPVENLWVNPDCGLKTRAWPETKAALEHMVEAAKILRKKIV